MDKTQLAAMAYKILMESSRKHLSHLLCVLLESVEQAALERMCFEAQKIGAHHLPPRNAPFQTCSHARLDGVFCYLTIKDLRAAEIVCRTWRAACRDGHAGWTTALATDVRYIDDDWVRECQRRQLIAMPKHMTVRKPTKWIMAQVARNTKLESLAFGDELPFLCAFSLVSHLPRLTHISFPPNYRYNFSNCSDALRELADLPLANQLTALSNIDRPSSASLELLNDKFPALVHLDFHQLNGNNQIARANEFSRLKTVAVHQVYDQSVVNRISGWSNLTSLTLETTYQWMNIGPVCQHLTNLTTLILKGEDIAGSVDNLASRLTQLRTLRLTNQLSDKDTNALRLLVNLERLELDLCDDSWCKQIKNLPELPRLEVLSLCMGHVPLYKLNKDGMPIIARIPRLRALQISTLDDFAETAAKEKLYQLCSAIPSLKLLSTANKGPFDRITGHSFELTGEFDFSTI